MKKLQIRHDSRFLRENVDWIPYMHSNTDSTPYLRFYAIKYICDAFNDQKEMFKIVNLRYNADLSNPMTDVAVLIGKIARLSDNKDTSIEMWYWDDRFWAKGVDYLNVEYYHNKNHALYEITVNNSSKIFEIIQL